MNPDLRTAASIGIAAVLVQAKEVVVRAFYPAQEKWLEFPAANRKRWLSMVVMLKGA